MKTLKEKIEVMQAALEGKTIEFKSGIGLSWAVVKNPGWDWGFGDYRIKPATKPSIDWSHVSPEFKWMSRDASGHCALTEAKPLTAGYNWAVVQGRVYSANAFASLTPGDCDWKDSLVERPREC